jgi:ABC-2 type transport system ATP-binding protein
MIEVDNLSRRYAGLTAVDQVSFSIHRGEIIGLLGHNGAGKTTIMKMLTGYLEPSGGTITIAGLRMGEETRAIQAHIGYLPENCPAWPEMSVIDYLDYQALLHGVTDERERVVAVATAIRRTALADKATMPIQTLSRGYRQRVGVAQAILHNPDIVILDEPTNGLDPTQIRQMRDLIRELARESTVIVSTHILQEVQAVCERVLILRSGQLVVDADLASLQQSRRLLLTVDRPIDDELVRSEGVETFERLSDSESGLKRYAINAPPDEQELLAPRLARELTAAGVQLHALQSERRDLETLFAEINNSARAQEVVDG